MHVKNIPIALERTLVCGQTTKDRVAEVIGQSA